MLADRHAGGGRLGRQLKKWSATLLANALSTYVLDTVSTAAGVLLAASGLLSDAGWGPLLVFLGASYVVWGYGLSSSLDANWRLLASTGTSTSALSKLAYDLTSGSSPGTRRLLAAGGYVLFELLKESALLSRRVRPGAGERYGDSRAGDDLPWRRESRGGRLRGDAGMVDPLHAATQRPRGLRLVRAGMVDAPIPDQLLRQCRRGRARDDRLLQRRGAADAARRTGAGVRRGADAPSCLPDGGKGLRDPRRRLS